MLKFVGGGRGTVRGGAPRRGLNGAEGAAGFRDQQGEETIHAAPKAPENISAGNFHDLIHAFMKADGTSYTVIVFKLSHISTCTRV